MIVHNALCGKASEPWIIWEGVTKLIRSLLLPNLSRGAPVNVSDSPTARLEQFGLVSGKSTSPAPQQRRPSRFTAIAQVFWTTLQFAAMVWMALRAFLVALTHRSSIPERNGGFLRDKSPNKVRLSAVAPVYRPSPQHTPSTACNIRPVVSMRIWTCISELSDIEHRMPWLAGWLSLLRYWTLFGPGRICEFNSVLDR
jgi:hypothetical protein